MSLFFMTEKRIVKINYLLAKELKSTFICKKYFTQSFTLFLLSRNNFRLSDACTQRHEGQKINLSVSEKARCVLKGVLKFMH